MKKAFGTILIALMLLSTLTFAIYAEEFFVKSADELINNLSNDNTLTLICDASTKNVIQITDKQNITIDLNGFIIQNNNDSPLINIRNCKNIKLIDSSEDASGAFNITLKNADDFENDSPYIAINVDNSSVSIEGLKIDCNSEKKGLNAQLFNLINQSELQLIDCDISTNNIGKVIKADNSKVYLGKNNQELTAANLPDKLTKVTVNNFVVPSSGVQSHAGAVCLDNGSLIEAFADICLKSYVTQTNVTGREGSVAAILSNKSAVNIYGGTVENRCSSDDANNISLYALESYKPSETNGLVISYKANEFDNYRIYGTELISNHDTVFVSPAEIGVENYDNPCNNYKIILDYASVVSADGGNAITSISKYSGSSYNNIAIDSKCALIYGNVVYRKGFNKAGAEEPDNEYSYSAFYNGNNGDSNDKYIVLTRDLEIQTYKTLRFQDVNVAVAKGATLNVLGAIENNNISGVNNSKLQINGQYELRGKCDFDVYVYGKATFYELTNGNIYPKDNGDVFLDTSVVRFVQNNRLVYNKERQKPVFDAYFGNRLIKDLSPGNTIEFEQDKQFKVSASTSSIFYFAGTDKSVGIVRVNNSSTNSHIYLNGDTTATFTIEKADYSALNPDKNLRVRINNSEIRYRYKATALLVDFLYDDDKREFQWYREVDGEIIKIEDETEYEYIIRAEDIGNKVFCQVSFGNYTDVINSDKATVIKGTGRAITFPNVSEITYPQKISEATLTGGSTNGTFAWENPDEILTPGTHTRNLIFTPNDSHLYDYSNDSLSKAMTIKVNKGVPSPIVFPDDANVDYPSPIKDAVFTGASTNGTFTWDNPDEQLPPGDYTRKITFEPNDKDLYDYDGVEKTQEVSLTVNKVDPQQLLSQMLEVSETADGREIKVLYQVKGKPGVGDPTGKIIITYRVTDNAGTQTDTVIGELDLAQGKTEIGKLDIGNDDYFEIVAKYSGDDYYNSSEISTIPDFNVSYIYGNEVENAPELPEATKCNCGASVTVAAEPTLTGYDFSGWSVKTPTGRVITDGKFKMPSYDVILEGSWAAHTYTVSYDKNADEANGTTTASSHTYDKESSLTSNGYSNPGFVFIGWSTTPGGNTVAYEDEEAVKNLTADKDGEIILYAVWKACTSVTANPPAQIELTGQGDPKPKTFTLKLVAESNTASLDAMPMPAAANGEQSMEAEIVGAGSLKFGTITFTKPGTYVYKITELDNGLAGYTYDEAVYTVEYVVTQNGDALEVVRTIKKDGSPAENVVFTNNYAPTAVKATKISVEKVLTGNNQTTSEITIKAEDENSPMPAGGSIITIKGAGKAEFGEIEFTKAGTYVYTVTEKSTGADDDEHEEVYTLTYIVKDKDGVLEVSCMITKDGNELDEIVFSNQPEPPVPPQPDDEEPEPPVPPQPDDVEPEPPVPPQPDDEEPEPPVPPQPDDEESEPPVLPQTGDTSNLPIRILLWILSSLGLSGVAYCKKRKILFRS